MALYEINETHDPKLESWVESANDAGTDFPIQNLPFCTFQRLGEKHERDSPKLGVRIGQSILDIDALVTAKLLSEWNDEALLQLPDGAEMSAYYMELGPLNFLASEKPLPGNPAPRDLRRSLQKLLRADVGTLRDAGVGREAIRSLEQVRLLSPFAVHDYTDFYASVHHATNVGSMFRPDNPLLPNYKWLPVGYHGRASTIVPSGTPIRRPSGQQAPAGSESRPTFGPCKMLDYEMEMGFFVGRGNAMGEPVSIEEAEAHLFGMCIVNDWSARDIQKWEYQPLGPFLAKSFATSVSPYTVTMEALAPFRTPAFKRPEGDPKPLPHLHAEADQARGGIDITVEVHLLTEQMAQRGMSPVRLSTGNFRQMYWTIAQMLAHHTSNGCLVQPGDLMASGTISGPTRDSRGSLLELTWNGDPFANPPKVVPGTDRTPIQLPTGETRRFLEDGDEVIMKAYCQREGFRRIGFGECRGKVVGAGS